MNTISRPSLLNISEFLDDVSIVKLHDTNKYNSFVLNEKVINIKRKYATRVIGKLFQIKKRVDKIFNRPLDTILALYDKNNDQIAQINIEFIFHEYKRVRGMEVGVPNYIRIYLRNGPGWRNHKKIKEGNTNKREMKRLLLKYMNSGFTLRPFGEYDDWRYPISSEQYMARTFLDIHREVEAREPPARSLLNYMAADYESSHTEYYEGRFFR